MIRRGSGSWLLPMVLSVVVCLWLSVGTAAALTQTSTPTLTLTPTKTPTPHPQTCFQVSECGCSGICLSGDGGEQCLGVTAPPDCCWTATVSGGCSDNEIIEGNAGCGNGSICFTYGLNLCGDNPNGVFVSVGEWSCAFTQDYGPTPRMPTPTFTPTPPPLGACVGDCNGDGEVTIDELILLVNIALGNAPGSVCPGVDQWCNGGVLGVTINCIIEAVTNALYGCGVTLPTPTPQCSTASCEGPCTILPPCTPGSACPQYVVLGVCEPNFFNGCQCQPVQPVTPTPTPPVLPHGHTCCECGNAACTDFAWVEVEPTCPVNCTTFTDAECKAPGPCGPLSGPPVCVPLTPCTTDADCDDGNGCSMDQCTIDGCTHVCVCD